MLVVNVVRENPSEAQDQNQCPDMLIAELFYYDHNVQVCSSFRRFTFTFSCVWLKRWKILAPPIRTISLNETCGMKWFFLRYRSFSQSVNRMSGTYNSAKPWLPVKKKKYFVKNVIDNFDRHDVLCWRFHVSATFGQTVIFTLSSPMLFWEPENMDPTNTTQQC